MVSRSNFMPNRVMLTPNPSPQKVTRTPRQFYGGRHSTFLNTCDRRPLAS